LIYFHNASNLKKIPGEKMQKKSILLVEDDIALRESTRLILEMKYHVLEASDYSEALNKLKNPLDLAIIDYILPDYDGFDLLKEIRKVKPELPVIMMTGYGTEDVAIKAIRAGATDYIKKPINPVYLMNRVSELLGEKVAIEDNGNKYLKGIENRDEFIVEGIARYIEEKYREDLGRKKILDMSSMNRDKFSKVFKERFGQTFISYLQSIRVRNAAELLRNPDLSISEVAHSVGYESIAHFERLFKEKYGLSPSEYRKKLKQKDY